MNTYSADDIVIVEVPMKRGQVQTVRFRTSRYEAPKGGWSDADFLEMARAQVDRWLVMGQPRIVKVAPCAAALEAKP